MFVYRETRAIKKDKHTCTCANTHTLRSVLKLLHTSLYRMDFRLRAYENLNKRKRRCNEQKPQFFSQHEPALSTCRDRLRLNILPGEVVRRRSTCTWKKKGGNVRGHVAEIQTKQSLITKTHPSLPANTTHRRLLDP